MLKKLGLTTLTIAGMLAFAAPRKAEARTHIGVYFGAPAYTYPVQPYYAAPAPDYYNYPAPSYDYPAPAYVDPYYAAPSYGYGFGFAWGGHDRDHWRHEMHERQEHHEHEFREHGGWRR